MVLSWVKISTDLFNNRKIKYIRTFKDGNDMALVWIMLLTLAGRCNDKGSIYITDGVPYTAKALARELDIKESTIVSALNTFEQLSMIERKDGFIRLLGWEEYQSVGGMEKVKEQTRKRVAEYRNKQKCNADDSVTCNVTVTQCNAIEREKEKEEEKEYSLSLYLSRESDFENLPNAAENVENSVENSNGKRQRMGGELGQGYLFISDEQFDDLCEKLSPEEIEHYCAVIVNCEKAGRHFGKTHYQAILDMADKDRRKNEGRK